MVTTEVIPLSNHKRSKKIFYLDTLFIQSYEKYIEIPGKEAF